MAAAACAGLSRQGRRIAAAATLSLLAACSSLPPPFSELGHPAPEQPQQTAELPPAPRPDPSDISDSSSASAPEIDNSPAARAARLAGRPPAEPLRDLPRLVGLSRELVVELLGPAGFVRRDGPVQIWRYANDECFLDLFLYREGSGYRVHHAEARTKTTDEVAVNTCYRRLVAERRAG